MLPRSTAREEGPCPDSLLFCEIEKKRGAGSSGVALTFSIDASFVNVCRTGGDGIVTFLRRASA
jgi:hypothetical protein